MKKKTMMGRLSSLLFALALVWGGVSCTPQAPVDPTKYTITFDSQGGSEVAAQEVAENVAATAPEEPTKDGYTFVEWLNGETAYDWNAPVTGNLTLTAKWAPTEYKITYLPEGVETDNPPTYTIETETFELKAPTNAPDATKPNFVAWHNGEKPTEGNWVIVDSIEKGTTGDLTIVAEFSDIKPWKVTFDSDGGSKVASQSVIDGNKATEPKAPTKDGYEFDGWYNGGTKFDFATVITGDITLKAKWTVAVPKDYTVTFVTNGGSAVESVTKTSGTAISLIIPTTDPTMTGFTFAGWYLDENFEQPLNLSSILTKNITLYAKWDKAATGLGTSWEDLAPVSPETTIFSSTPENGACSIWFKGVSGEVKKGDRLRVDFTISSNNLTNYKQFAIKTNAFEADWAGAKKWIDKPTETSLTWGATIVADTDIGDGYHNFAIQIDNQITASTSVEEFEISGLTIRNYGPADEGTIYEALGPSASFVIPKNYEYGTTPDNYSYAKLQNFQYQAPLELSGIKKDSKLKIKIAGSCDMAVPKLKVQIVDISEAAKFWTSVSGDQVVLVEKIEANTDFSNEIELSISSDTDSSSIVIVLAIDKTDLIPTKAEFSKDSKDPTFSLTDFKVVKE